VVLLVFTLSFQIFLNSLVAPVLLYASEIWGFENKNSIERVHLQFCKSILKVRNSAPKFLVYGELERFPLVTIYCETKNDFVLKIYFLTIFGKQFYVAKSQIKLLKRN
jgi:hypothetical protein